MAVKRETGGRDGAGEPAHPDQLSYSTSPDPNIALPFPKVIPYPGDTLFPEVPESKTLGTESGVEGSIFKACERRYRLSRSRRMQVHQLHHDYIQESVDAFLALCVIDSPRKKLQSSVRLELDPIRAQLDALNTLSDELRAFEERQGPVELSLDNATARLLTPLQTITCVEDDCIEDQSDCTPQPPIPSELEAYYASVSMLRNMEERIGELQIEQQEQWERRGLMEDQGRLLDQCRDESLRDWEETLSMAQQDWELARESLVSARRSCEDTGIVIPIWAEIDTGEQHAFDDADCKQGELILPDGPETQLKYLEHVKPWYESFGKGRLDHHGIWNDTSDPRIMPAWGQLISDVRKKWPCNPSRLVQSHLPLIAALVPLATAGSNAVMAEDVLPTVIELNGLHSPQNDYNAVKELLGTASQYILAFSPPLILIGGVVVSAWILTREKRAFKPQQFLFLMTFTASVSWWVLAATTNIGDQGSVVSISTWLALTAIYTSRNHRGLRNGTWHLFVVLFGGLAITSLFALALPTANEASMERFIQNFLIVGPSVVTVWSWLAARGQRQLEGSANAVTQEGIELQGSASAVSQ